MRGDAAILALILVLIIGALILDTFTRRKP